MSITERAVLTTEMRLKKIQPTPRGPITIFDFSMVFDAPCAYAHA
jgi:hypothetical protein